VPSHVAESSERDDLVDLRAGQCFVELWETARDHAVNQPLRLHVSAAALLEGAVSEITPNGALIAHHQQHAALGGDSGETLTDRITLPKTKNVVIKKHHADNLSAVTVLLQLRKDHGSQLVDGGQVGDEDVCNSHGQYLAVAVWLGVSITRGVDTD